MENLRIVTINNNESIWDRKKKILVILAHPDDPEFFCGATLAKWVGEGHHINYCLLTRGEKGTNDHFTRTEQIREIRKREQENAAVAIGAKQVFFMDNPDGFLMATLDLRKELVKVMRKQRPDIVISCDPTNYFIHGTSINHPDHRAAGQVTLDAIFPAVQNADFYPDLLEEGYTPHHVEELWLSLPTHPNISMAVSATWEQKIAALLKHSSQIGDAQEFVKRMHERGEDVHYCEEFHRIVIRK
ncbi:MAG: PIG-L family deacetylase [Chloroflexi bacterium]|nr:PIG-L family deacetylase [Chloroflexota bacterium]